jgi:hypothetical protein
MWGLLAISALKPKLSVAGRVGGCMAEEAPQQGSTTGDLAGKAWASAIDGLGQMPLLYLSAYAAEVALNFAETRILNWWNAQGASYVTGSYRSLELVLLLICGLFSQELARALILAPLAVGVHRFVLMGERARGIISLRYAHTWNFVAYLVMLQWVPTATIVTVAALTAGFNESSGVPLNWLFFLVAALAVAFAFAALIISSIQLALVFPALATDVASRDWRERLRTSWRLMRGNGMILFVSSILTAIPVWIVLFVIIVVKRMISSGAALVAPSSDGFQVSFWSPALTVALVAVGAALLSWLYRFIHDPAGWRTSGGGPRPGTT